MWYPCIGIGFLSTVHLLLWFKNGWMSWHVKIKDVTSLKHPSNISVNVWGLLGSSCLHGLSFGKAQAVTCVCLPEEFCVFVLTRPATWVITCYFLKVSTHFKGSSGRSTNVLFPAANTCSLESFWINHRHLSLHDKCVDYLYLIVTELRKTTHKSKGNYQSFQVWKAKC